MSTAEREPRRSGSVQLAEPPYWDAYDPRFPDSDGEPMADNQTQYKWMVTIAEGLDALFADVPDVLVACDLLWYFDQSNPKRCIAPDVFVAFGRPKAYRHSYKEWLEGHAPQVVFEIHSPSNTSKRMREKWETYNARGVEEYYYYDPDTGRLEGWIRGPEALEPIAATDGWTSPRLGVTFETPAEEDALILRGPDGEPFQHVQDIIRDRKLARRVAEIERRRREQADDLALEERRLREEAESAAHQQRARAERLATLLREMGVDPD